MKETRGGELQNWQRFKDVSSDGGSQREPGEGEGSPSRGKSRLHRAAGALKLGLSAGKRGAGTPKKIF